MKRQETGEESGSDAHFSSNLDCVGTSDEKDERFHVLRSFFLASQLLFPLNTASVVPRCAEKTVEAESKSALATQIAVLWLDIILVRLGILFSCIVLRRHASENLAALM